MAEENRAAGDDLASSAHGQVGLVTEGRPDGQLSVQAVRPGSPAARAGLRPGDLILQVNGGCPREVGGGVGTAVRLTVQRPSESARPVTLVREAVPVEPVLQIARLKADPGIGDLRFDSSEPDQVGAQLQAELYLLSRPGPCAGWSWTHAATAAGNSTRSGGFLGIFLDGPVGEYRDRDGAAQPLNTVHTVGEAMDRLRGVPVVVLVSAYTRSGG